MGIYTAYKYRTFTIRKLLYGAFHIIGRVLMLCRQSFVPTQAEEHLILTRRIPKAYPKYIWAGQPNSLLKEGPRVASPNIHRQCTSSQFDAFIQC